MEMITKLFPLWSSLATL